MNESFHLYQLQIIDSQIDKNNIRIHDIYKILKFDDEVEKSKDTEALRKNILQKVKIELQKIDNEVETKKIKINQSDSHLYSGKVKNPKELQDLQNELKSLRKNLSLLEDQQLEKLIAFEEIELEYKKAKNSLTIAISNFETKKSILESEKDNLMNDNNRLEIERKAILTQISDSDLSIYQHLRQEKHGLAVSNLENNACSACGAILTPGQRQATRSAQSIFYCPSCGRIIYGG